MTPEQLRRLASLVDDLEMDGYQIEDAELLPYRDGGAVAAVELSLPESDEDAADDEWLPAPYVGDRLPSRNDADEPEDEVETSDKDQAVELTDAEQDVVDVLENEGELPRSEIKFLTERSEYISEVLQRLRNKDILEHRKDPEDGRRYLYSLAWDDGVDEGTGGASHHPPDTSDIGTGGLTPAVRPLDEDQDGASHPGGVDEPDTGGEDAPGRDYDQDLVVEDLNEVGEARARSLRQQVRAADEDVSDEQLAVQIGATVEVVQMLRSEVKAIEARPDGAADSGSASLPPTSASAPESSPSSGGPLQCQNCGAHVSRSYAAVFTPEDVEQPRACPSCPDKIRERDGSVRDARSSRSDARRVDQ